MEAISDRNNLQEARVTLPYSPLNGRKFSVLANSKSDYSITLTGRALQINIFITSSPKQGTSSPMISLRLGYS